MILGAGFAGLAVAQHLRGVSATMTVCDPARAQTYTPWLYEIASGGGGTADISLSGIAHHHVRFRHARAQRIDAAARRIFFDDHTSLAYDILVIAVGSRAHDLGIPGVREFALMLKTSVDAQRIAHEVHACIAAKGPRALVIVGGGPTGVEFTGEVAVIARRLRPQGGLHLTLVDANGCILSRSRASMSTAVMRRLMRLGVTVRCGTVVERIDARGVHVRERNGNYCEILPADCVLWATGTAAHAEVAGWGMPTDAAGRITVEPTFAVPGFPGVFALGDAAIVQNPRRGNLPDPWAAQVAVRQAAHVARNIRRALRGRALRPFSFPRYWHLVLAVGSPWGVADLFGFTLHGRLAFFLRRAIDFKWLIAVVPLRRAIRRWRQRKEEV